MVVDSELVAEQKKKKKGSVCKVTTLDTDNFDEEVKPLTPARYTQKKKKKMNCIACLEKKKRELVI